jgi:predicted lipoprotein with Yx(FWY)xxD motif
MRRVGAVVAALAFVLAPAVHGAGGRAVVSTAYNKTLKTTILVDSRGFTLYIWTADPPNMSVCVNDATYHCSKHWIPVRTTGAPIGKGGANAASLGTITRDDGTTQVTYKHRPLYTWVGLPPDPGDKKPGQINGQGYLSSWYVLAPSGKLIKKGG